MTSSEDRTPRNGQADAAPLAIPAGALPAGIFFADHRLPALVFERGTLRILEANRAACTLYGYSAEEFRRLTLADILPPEDVPLLRQFVDGILPGPPPAFWRHRTRDGRILQVRIAGQDITYGGRAARITFILEHTPVEEALAAARDAEQRFRSIFDYAGHAIVVFDMDLGRFVEANDDACRLFGLSREQLLQQSPAALSPERQPSGERSDDLARARLERALAGEPMEFEWVHQDAAGRLILCEVRLVRMPPFDRRLIRGAILDIRQRRAAEAELQRREREFRSLAENSPDLIVRFDDDLRIIYANPAALASVGAELRTVAGLRPTQFLPGSPALERWERAVAAVLETRQPLTLEGPSDFRGPGAYSQTHLIPEFDEDGAIASVLSITRDLTEIYRAAAENARLAAIVAFSRDAMVTTDLEGRITSWNRGAELALGYAAPEVLGRTTEFLFDPEALPLRDWVRSRVLAGENIEDMERPWRRRDGSTVILSSSYFPLRSPAGDIIGIGSVARDVTERVRAQQALQQSEARLRDLLDAVSAAVWVSDGRNALFVNAEMERLTGYSRDELLAPVFLASLIAEEDIPVMLRHFERRLQGLEQVSRFTIRISTRSGELRHLRVAASPFQFDGRDATILSALDTTDLVHAEEERRRLDLQVQQTQKLESLGVLAGGIAHDFNNLLVAILGNAGLALMELPPESPARQTVLAIETAAQRAAELTRQMLAYSGKGKFVIEQLNLSRVVEEMAHLLEISVSKRAVLRYRFAPDLPAIEGDATQLRQVIMNLITNASDAIGDRSGVISVSTGIVDADAAYLKTAYMDDDLPEGQYVYLEVADTGIGMDAETAARIFDPFFTTKFTGRGLGLAAVLGIVRSHRGAIKLSTAPGRGTTFTILFPAAGPPAPPGPAPAPETASTPLPRAVILVVDDDETVRAVTRRMLELSGFTVLLAADGAEAVALYRERPGIDLVLLDLTMPAMDGEETFRELRRLDPGVRVILTSGYSEQDAADRFAGTGLAGFIQKPYRPQDLIETVRAALQSQT
ncbi:PAS domain S-box protein [Tepidiforma bonchosmolovskayae]|uniref:histidine kinase n=1 Tax=Tepidiforma bonchosmolovskayae TaxID=2601677 RepID=A0ABX6C3U9_9CHLR|nr:PAS domain S-box protein [Tepidiforma bonchosmolovskayae]QFG03705.1 PAS domain S-box protein [Tepidiforma bonchosmolovskayae]